MSLAISRTDVSVKIRWTWSQMTRDELVSEGRKTKAWPSLGSKGCQRQGPIQAGSIDERRGRKSLLRTPRAGILRKRVGRGRTNRMTDYVYLPIVLFKLRMPSDPFPINPIGFCRYCSVWIESEIPKRLARIVITNRLPF